MTWSGRTCWGMGLATALVVLLGLGLYTWLAQPRLPQIDLAGVDPEIVQAIAAARREVQQQPSAASFGKLGMLYLAHGFLPPAALCFAEAEQRDGGDARWPYYRAQTQPDDPPAAIEHLQRAAARAGSGNLGPRLALAERCLDQGRWTEAKEHFEEVLAHQKDNERATLGLARVHVEMGNQQAALERLRSLPAKPRAPRMVQALLAQIHQLAGKPADAAQALALPTDPPWPDPYLEDLQRLVVGKRHRLNQIQRLRQQGQIAEARELAGQLEREYPDVYWLVEARLQQQRGNLDQAVEAYRKSIALAPEAVEPRLELAQLHQKQRRFEEAMVELGLLLKREPGHGPAQFALGQCARASGDLDTAQRAFQQAAAAMPLRAEVHRELAAVLEARGDKAAAQRHRTQAAHLDGKQ